MRPRLGVWKFSSCDGCQLSILDAEDELLELGRRLDIAYFPEATRKPLRGRFDLSLVEGSVGTPQDARRVLDVRARSRVLVAIGACATAGGIQALRNFRDAARMAGVVYPRPDWAPILPTSTPISEHVRVDFELRGCPISKAQLVETVRAFLRGAAPAVRRHSVCMECKRAGAVCVLVAHGTPCLGPVTRHGCGALCPRCDRGCYGCYGPQEDPNAASLARKFARLGLSAEATRELYRNFNVWAPAFRRAQERS
ncbi:MAG: oxidoreductase [Elusimicrobia bacterium]|nr:oxidoreductase [Elusimicrobiota bacterium]